MEADSELQKVICKVSHGHKMKVGPFAQLSNCLSVDNNVIFLIQGQLFRSLCMVKN